MGKTSRRKRTVQDAAQDEIVVEDERLARRAPPLMPSMDGCVRLGGGDASPFGCTPSCFAHIFVSTVIIELLEAYFAERKDLEAFEAQVNEQMAAYEETEEKVVVVVAVVAVVPLTTRPAMPTETERDAGQGRATRRGRLHHGRQQAAQSL